MFQISEIWNRMAEGNTSFFTKSEKQGKHTLNLKQKNPNRVSYNGQIFEIH